MIGLTGPRGVGKTTLVLQHIKKNLNPSETLYVTAEDFYFADNKLIELAGDFVKRGGKYLFIDEIHKYKDWAKELNRITSYNVCYTKLLRALSSLYYSLFPLLLKYDQQAYFYRDQYEQ